MQKLVRETIAARLVELPALANRYQSGDASYVDDVLGWLRTTAAELGRLRHPLAGIVSSQQALIVAIRNGYRPEHIAAMSRRRSVAAAATLAIGEVEPVLRAAVAELDGYLREMTDRMAQLLAVASADHPVPLPPTEPRDAWLDQVWEGLRATNGGGGMFGYLNARLTRSDRNALLDELLANVLEATGPPAER